MTSEQKRWSALAASILLTLCDAPDWAELEFLAMRKDGEPPTIHLWEWYLKSLQVKI